MSKDFIGFRVTPDVKEQLEAEAEKEMRPLSHLIRDRVVRPLEVKEERAKALAQAKEAVENDSSNLNATLDDKGSVVKDEALMPSVERTAWIAKRTRELGGRMSSRNAEATAKKEWEAANN